jgi:hypothetical protein
LTNSGGALPAGLSAGVDYWFVRIDDDTGKLAISWANAVKSSPIVVDITDTGSGTHTLGGLPAAPSGNVTDYGSLRIKADELLAISAPGRLTVKGASSSDILTYWWV